MAEPGCRSWSSQSTPRRANGPLPAPAPLPAHVLPRLRTGHIPARPAPRSMQAWSWRRAYPNPARIGKLSYRPGGFFMVLDSLLLICVADLASNDKGTGYEWGEGTRCGPEEILSPSWPGYRDWPHAATLLRT